MALPTIFKDPICFETFQNNDTEVCSRCEIAWFPKEGKRDCATFSRHQSVCNAPDTTEITYLPLRESLERIDDMLLSKHGFDHNTGYLLYHIDDLLRAEGRTPLKKRSESAQSMDENSDRLHSSFRETVLSLDYDEVRPYFERLWACPGVPQFLLRADLRSNTYAGMVARYPNGVRGVPQEELKKYNAECDTSGEWMGMLVVQILVFSCVVPRPGNNQIEWDGDGELQDTPYSHAAWARLVELVTREDAYRSLLESMFPVPMLIANIAKNKPDEFNKCLQLGIAPFLCSYSDMVGAQMALELIPSHLSSLSTETKLEIVAQIWRFIPHDPNFWKSYMEDPSEADVFLRLIVRIAVNVGMDVLLSSPQTALPPSWTPVTRAGITEFLPKLAMCSGNQNKMVGMLKNVLEGWRKEKE